MAQEVYGTAWLAEHGLAPGARVGSCRQAQRFGTVCAVKDSANVYVTWDDRTSELLPWTAVAPFPYEVATDADNLDEVA